jgi:hypothetical protein
MSEISTINEICQHKCIITYDILCNYINDYNNLNSLDTTRAYNECREDLTGLRNKDSAFSYFAIILAVLGTFLAWEITSWYYKKKITEITAVKKK